MLSIRVLVFWLCAVGAFVCVAYGATRLLDRYEVATPRTSIEVGEMLASRLGKLTDAAHERTKPLVLYLGDSTAMTNPYRRAIPERMTAALRRDLGTNRIQVAPFVSPGLWIYDFYFFVDRMIAIHPSAVVVTLNLASTSAAWMQFNVHPELAAWLDPARLVGAALLPLERSDLNTDRLLLYVGLQSARAESVWHWVRSQQARVGVAQRLWTAWLDRDRQQFEVGRIAAVVADAQAATGDGVQGPREGQLARYGTALSGLDRDHPVLRMLGATVRALSDAGVPTLVYLFPLNIEGFTELGIYDPSGLAHSVSTVEAVVEAAGGDFLDLHALLPQSGFADAQGHPAIDRGFDAPLAIADALAQHLATYPSLRPAGGANGS